MKTAPLRFVSKTNRHMKKHLFSLLFACLVSSLFAQNLPVRSVTLFKNNRSLLQKSGKVSVQDGLYTLTELPNALFGTFWVASNDGNLQSVFSIQDSVDAPSVSLGTADLLKLNIGKPLRLYLINGGESGYEPIDAVCESVLQTPRQTGMCVFKTAAGKWLTLSEYEIHRVEFASTPNTGSMVKKAQKRLEMRFKPGVRESTVDLAYLTSGLGWAPIYRLELNGKNKGHLALRAEINNDAEDLGDTELRLAVGVPNFAFANRPEALVNFDPGAIQPIDADNPYRGNTFQFANQVSFNNDLSLDYSAADDGKVEGSQAEDFYFYSVRPGDFPKGSRFQYPIFETDVEPTHFYECVLNPGSQGSYNAYKDSRSAKETPNPVFHYIEFKNKTAFPWTTGAVNLLSQNTNGLQPISQDLLPYTAPGGTCKVKIAQTPEIKVTHAEGDVDRQENAKKFFSTTYDRVKIEAQVVVVNYGDEPVTIKVRRTLEGNPLNSELKWTTKQELATLRVNPSYTLEWVLELKPGEERKWTYGYEVFVNM